MKVKITQIFDAPLDIVVRARDERFDHIDKIEGLKKQNILERKEDDTTIKTRRAFETGKHGVPDAVKKMLSPEMFKFVETAVWRKEDNRLEWKMTPGTQKDRLIWKGVSRYIAKGDKTERVIECSVKVKIPLLGGQMEKTIAASFKKSMEKDHRTISAMAEMIKNGEV